MRELRTYKVIICIDGSHGQRERLWVRTFLGLPTFEQVLATLDRDRIALEEPAEKGSLKAITEKFASFATMVQDNGLPASGGRTACLYCGVQIGRIELRSDDLVVEVARD